MSEYYRSPFELLWIHQQRTSKKSPQNEARIFEPPYALQKELEGLETDIAFGRAGGPGVMREMRKRAAEIRQELLRLEYEFFAPERRAKKRAQK